MNTSDFQESFHNRWYFLTDLHVRSLAWLLESPNLLDPFFPLWDGKIASLPEDSAIKDKVWLESLNTNPLELHKFLNIGKFMRLGRYAEKLLAFYFIYKKILFAHGLQIREDKNQTIGEFDFLLKDGQELIHWEFATKFYLLNSNKIKLSKNWYPDYFVGPNIVDTLGKKMRKILNKQLSLRFNPATKKFVNLSIKNSYALIKGWIFYHLESNKKKIDSGISLKHCQGWWCSYDEINDLNFSNLIILPKSSWLAPVSVKKSEYICPKILSKDLNNYFLEKNDPIMVAFLKEYRDKLVETSRGFIVPNNWKEKASKFSD